MAIFRRNWIYPVVAIASLATWSMHGDTAVAAKKKVVAKTTAKKKVSSKAGTPVSTTVESTTTIGSVSTTTVVGATSTTTVSTSPISGARLPAIATAAGTARIEGTGLTAYVANPNGPCDLDGGKSRMLFLVDGFGAGAS